MSVDTGQDAARCPRCGALARAGSQWCTLCYADLRPAPSLAAPAAASLGAGVVADNARSAPESVDPLTAPLALLDRRLDASAAPTARGRHAAPEPDDEAAPEPPGAWPCLRCGALVALDEQTCGGCGAAFLEGAHEDGGSFDALIGKATTTQAKVLIMVGGSALIVLLFVGVAYLLGAIL